MSKTHEIEEYKDVPSEAVSPQDANYEHIVKYTGFFGGIQVLTILVSVVRNKLAVILLNQIGIGLTSLYNSITGFLSNATNMGVSFSSIKHLSEIYEHEDVSAVGRYVEIIRTWSVWTAIFGLLLTVLFSPLISWFAFEDYSHALPISLLSPIVAFMSVTAGELAILKAVRRLHRVALISVLGALFTLILTIPFYYFFGIRGVIPALNVSTLGVMIAHLSLSLPVFPFHVSLCSKEYFKEGWSLIRLGVPYIMAGVVNTLSVMGISFFINRVGSTADVGLYSMGFTLVITYAGIVFTAVDADYFPRLSAVHDDSNRMNTTINRQVKVCLLLMAPFLVLFMLMMPFVIQLLYSSEFLPITGMAVFASLHMFFKSMTLPVAYTALAKADSLIYLIMEIVYDVVMVGLVVAGYMFWGITGTGIALALAGIFDFFLIYVVYGRRYDFRPDMTALPFAVSQMFCVLSALYLALQADWLIKICVGLPLLCVSLCLSIRTISKEISILDGISKRLRGKFTFKHKREA